MQDLLTQALEYIKGQETGMTALKLASLTLEGYPQVSVQRHGRFLFPSCHDFHEHSFKENKERQIETPRLQKVFMYLQTTVHTEQNINSLRILFLLKLQIICLFVSSFFPTLFDVDAFSHVCIYTGIKIQ